MAQKPKPLPSRDEFYVADISVKSMKSGQTRVRATAGGDAFALSLFAALFHFGVIKSVDLGGMTLRIVRVILKPDGTVLIDVICSAEDAQKLRALFESGEIDFMKPSRLE